jgi:hypothetical protein
MSNLPLVVRYRPNVPFINSPFLPILLPETKVETFKFPFACRGPAFWRISFRSSFASDPMAVPFITASQVNFDLTTLIETRSFCCSGYQHTLNLKRQQLLKAFGYSPDNILLSRCCCALPRPYSGFRLGYPGLVVCGGTPQRVCPVRAEHERSEHDGKVPSSI